MGKSKSRNIRCMDILSRHGLGWGRKMRRRKTRSCGNPSQIKCHYGILSFGKEGPALWSINACAIVAIPKS